MLNLKRMCIIGLPLLALAVTGKFYVVPVKAATTSGRNLTLSVAELGIGLIVTDQISGAISFCADYNPNSAPYGHCAKLGHTTPSSAPPSPPTGLSVVVPSASNVGAASPGNNTLGASVYVVNNQTGDIVQCNTINENGTPVGSCVDLGITPQ